MAVQAVRSAGGEAGDGAAPAAMAAVVGHEALAQGVVGSGLQGGVEAGADDVAALGGGVGAEAVDELAADFLTEPLRPGDGFGLAEAGWDDGGGFGAGGLVGGDGVGFDHAVEHPVAAGLRGVREAERVVVVGGLGQGGEEGDFGQAQLIERFVEIGLGGGGDAVGLEAEVDFIEVEFEDLVLRHGLVDADGKDEFLGFAGEGDFIAEQHVLGDLLRDGRGADGAATLAVIHQVGPGGAGDGEGVDALMGPELLVFGGQECLLDHRGDGGDGQEDAAFGCELLDEVVVAGIDPAHDAGLVVAQAVERGQVFGVGLVGVPAEGGGAEAGDQEEGEDGRDQVGEQRAAALGRGGALAAHGKS